MSVRYCLFRERHDASRREFGKSVAKRDEFSGVFRGLSRGSRDFGMGSEITGAGFKLRGLKVLGHQIYDGVYGVSVLEALEIGLRVQC